MKKIMISLLMIAATLNAMAITYTGKVTMVLRASDNKASLAVIATSNALNDGLNSGYYAELNDEGKEVLLYVQYNSVRYEHFGSSDNTLRNMPLIMKANSATSYRLEFYEMEGTIEIYDTQAGANIDKSQPYIFTIEDEQKNTVIANRFIINYAPYIVTLNNSYLATFSATEAVAIPDGLNAYAAEYQSLAQVLLLHQISDVIPANTGVILYNPNYADDHKKEFSLDKHAAVPAISEVNHLSPATAYDPDHEGYVYVLSGSGMCIYEEQGQGMKPNKAFLQLPLSAPAPARIAFRFSEEQGVENIAAEGKAVKFIENGRVFIKRGDKVYNLQGQLVK